MLLGDIIPRRLIASGNIVVYGHGPRHSPAGADGYLDAFIWFMTFPVQLRIAVAISVFNNDRLKGPQKAILEGGRITVSSYEATVLKAVSHS